MIGGGNQCQACGEWKWLEDFGEESCKQCEEEVLEEKEATQ